MKKGKHEINLMQKYKQPRRDQIILKFKKKESIVARSFPFGIVK